MRLVSAVRVPFSPTPEAKQRALVNVRFEVEQVLSLLTRLHSTPAVDVVLRRALLERLVVHLRTIMGFLEMSRRTVHYSGGLRQENDDVLAVDYAFPAVRLAISEEERRELKRSRIALSYSSLDVTSVRMPAALLSLTVPVLRQCAAFARHLLSDSFSDLDEGEAGEWTRLRDALDIFATASQPAAVPS